MSSIVLALIFSFGAMFLAWRYHNAPSQTRANLREFFTSVFTMLVAVAVIFAAGALISVIVRAF